MPQNISQQSNMSSDKLTSLKFIKTKFRAIFTFISFNRAWRYFKIFMTNLANSYNRLFIPNLVMKFFALIPRNHSFWKLTGWFKIIVNRMATLTKHPKVLSFPFVRFVLQLRPMKYFTPFFTFRIFTLVSLAKVFTQPTMNTKVFSTTFPIPVIFTRILRKFLTLSQRLLPFYKSHLISKIRKGDTLRRMSPSLIPKLIIW